MEGEGTNLGQQGKKGGGGLVGGSGLGIRPVRTLPLLDPPIDLTYFYLKSKFLRFDFIGFKTGLC